MLPELEKPKVTEIQVRMDCNGCVQKIKKALHGINGIYDIYIDIPQQKLTIIGWADPEKIVKAIKKTRKTATICSHTSPLESEQPIEAAPPSEDATNPPGEEVSPPEPTPQVEPPSALENPPPDGVAPPQPTESATNQPPQSSGSKEVEEVHVIYHSPQDHPNNVRVYGGRMDHYSGSQGGLGFKHESPQPIHVNHSYNTYKPTPYVTEYEHIRPPPQYTPYNRPEPPRYTSYSWPEPPQQYTYYRQEPQLYNHPKPQPPYNRPEPPQRYSRPEPPQHYNMPEPLSQHYSPRVSTPPCYNRSEPPQPPHYSRPEPPPCYNRSEPPQPPHYSHPEPPPQQNYTDPPQNYNQPEPPQQTHYNRQEPPRQYTHYYEPPQQYTRHSIIEPSPLHVYNRQEAPDYMHYNGEYYRSSNRNDDITSPFGDEDPNGCRIV